MYIKNIIYNCSDFVAGRLSRLILIWTLYAVTYMYLRRTENLEAYTGGLSLLGEAGLDFLICVYTLKIINDFKSFFLFKLLFISFIFAFIADSAYNIILNILQINQFSKFIENIFDFPFLLFLFFKFYFG